MGREGTFGLPLSSTTTPGLRGAQGGLFKMAAPHEPRGAFKDLMPDQLHSDSGEQPKQSPAVPNQAFGPL